MSGSGIVRTDFNRAGDDTVAGEVHFSHDPRVDRFRAKVRLTEDGFQLMWTEPRAYAEGGPTRYRVLDDVSIVMVLPPDDDRHVEMRRCPVAARSRYVALASHSSLWWIFYRTGQNHSETPRVVRFEL